MLKLTPQLWRQLEDVQAQINGRVTGRVDMDLYGVPELWVVADREGDCEDYALAKRKALLDLGWPVEALRLAVCELAGGVGHAVLTVDTDRGTFYLDNMERFVERWGDAPFKWVKRQAAGGPEWVAIEPA